MSRKPNDWPDIVFAADHRHATLSAAARAGRLRRLAHGIYSPSPGDPAPIFRRNWREVLAHRLRGAVVVDASARTGCPDGHGRLFVDHPRQRPLVLPGLTIFPRQGPGPLPGDASLPDGIYLSSRARGLLDNLARDDSRRLSSQEIQDWIVDITTHRGADTINAIRDEARQLAPMMGGEAAFERLSAIVSAALSTGPATEDMTAVLRASADGAPHDRTRIARFKACAAYLSDRAPAALPNLPAMASRRALLPFFDAYFSNYIEGTEFDVDEAARIVFEHEIPAERPEDAHDIVGTYRIVSDQLEMRWVPSEPGELVDRLRSRHALLMAARPDKHPGMFKAHRNRVGTNVFVEPRLVEETLRVGFEVGRALEDPFARAVFMMFLVVEIHPFDDGNGRVARLMMNAELVAHAQVRVIIPTVYRNEYLSALRGATHNETFGPLTAVLAFAQRYTAQVDFSSLDVAVAELGRTNAFVDPAIAERDGSRLLLPSSLGRIE